MDQFSHDLTLALEETSLDRTRVGRWGQRLRTRSTGSLPSAPQPTEDSSSSPADVDNDKPKSANFDNIKHNIPLPSDSDDKDNSMRLQFANVDRSIRVGTIESDSLNETFSPARFFKPNTRRKRKFKRMSIEFEPSMQYEYMEPSTYSGSIRKRVLKPEAHRSSIFFTGKRKRSNKDRYCDFDVAKLQSSSVPRQNLIWSGNNCLGDYKSRLISFSPTSQPSADRILPLNEVLVSKIEKLSKLQKSFYKLEDSNKAILGNKVFEKLKRKSDTQLQSQGDVIFDTNVGTMCRKKCNRLKKENLKCQIQFQEHIYMECEELYDVSSSSSLSTSESEDEQPNDTDREGDDELTDWPGNEGSVFCDSKSELKRKLTKKPQLLSLKSDQTASIPEDDILMGFGDCQVNIKNTIEIKFQSSNPIAIKKLMSLKKSYNHSESNIMVPLKQVESEMSGETSNNFLSSTSCQSTEVREIRAGCRRIKYERPGYSIKTSVNERLARFLQDAAQAQIQFPDIEIYERESLINLSKLYSLHISLDKGCAVLTKTSGLKDATTKLYKYILAVINGFSKLTWLYPTKSTSAEEVVIKLSEWAIIFAAQHRVVNDKGPAFTSIAFKEWCQAEPVEHVLITTGVRGDNDQVELLNRVIISVIAKLSASRPEILYKHVSKVQKVVNSTNSKTTKCTPLDLMFGVKMKTQLRVSINEMVEAEMARTSL